MYRLIPGKRKLLISSDEVVAMSAIDNNVDVRQINAAIQIAEDRFIKPILCRDFYYDLRDKKNIVVTTVNKTYLEELINTDNTGEDIVLQVGDIVNAIEWVSEQLYLDLWYEYLWKLVAETVVYIASPTNFTRFTAQGEMENNPKGIGMDGQGSASVELSKMKWKMDKMLQDRIDPITASMMQWIYENRSYFPLMNCRQWNTLRIQDGVSVERKTGWVHGVYDRTDRTGCYSCRDQNRQYPYQSGNFIELE